MNPKIVIEVRGGNIQAIHSTEPVGVHIVDWDNADKKGEQEFVRTCKQELEQDYLIDSVSARSYVMDLVENEYR